MLFMSPKTAVVEFPTSAYHPQFKHLAACIDIDYWVVPSITAFIEGFYSLDDAKVADVLSTVSKIVEEKGLEHLYARAAADEL